MCNNLRKVFEYVLRENEWTSITTHPYLDMFNSYPLSDIWLPLSKDGSHSHSTAVIESHIKVKCVFSDVVCSRLLFHVELLLQQNGNYVMHELPEVAAAGIVLCRDGHIRTLIINSESHLAPL